jgi:hypothetical protein
LLNWSQPGDKITMIDREASIRKTVREIVNLEVPQWQVHQTMLTYSLMKFWQTNLDSLFETACEKYSIFNGSEMFDDLIDLERIQVYENYPALLWTNIFATSFHSCESLAEKICKFSEPSTMTYDNFLADTKQKRQYGINKLLRFLAINKVDSNIENSNELILLKYLRDVIIHNNASLHESKNENELRQYISKSKLINLEGSLIRFDHEFVLYAIQKLQLFLINVRSAFYPHFDNTVLTTI